MRPAFSARLVGRRAAQRPQFRSNYCQRSMLLMTARAARSLFGPLGEIDTGTVVLIRQHWATIDRRAAFPGTTRRLRLRGRLVSGAWHAWAIVGLYFVADGRQRSCTIRTDARR